MIRVRGIRAVHAVGSAETEGYLVKVFMLSVLPAEGQIIAVREGFRGRWVNLTIERIDLIELPDLPDPDVSQVSPMWQLVFVNETHRPATVVEVVAAAEEAGWQWLTPRSDLAEQCAPCPADAHPGPFVSTPNGLICGRCRVGVHVFGITAKTEGELHA